jgi:DNA repair exonuclease SbcCD ATPase subunit
MRLERLRLAGLTRYRKPVELDLGSLGPGLVAFAGPNGAGKTTLLECCGPGWLYRELPTRDPPLLQHWAGPGGARLEVEALVGGAIWKAEVLVDRPGASPTAALEVAGRTVASKAKEYDAYVRERLGPLPAFLASSFAAQGGRGRFAALSVADRKSLFRYYLDLGRLDGLLARVRGRAAECDRAGKEAADLREALVDTWRRERPAAHDALRAAEAAAEAARPALAAASARHDRVRELVALRELAGAYERALNEAAAAADRLAELEEAPLAPYPEEPCPDVGAARRALDEARAAAERLAAANAAANEARIRARHTADMVAAAREVAKLLGEVPCEGEGVGADCRLLGNARTSAAALPGFREEAAAAGEALRRARAAQGAAAEACPDDRVAAAQAALRAVEAAAAEWSKAVSRADLSKAALGHARTRAAEAAARARELRARLPAKLPEDLPTGEDARHAAEAEKAARAAVERTTREVAEAAGHWRALEDRLADLKRKLRAARSTSRDWPALKLLEQALGPGGVQALEVAAAGPCLSATATDLLSVCTGDRFAVEVRTTRELRSREGLAEDFEVVAYDTVRGGCRPTAALSGGEQVLVDEAVRLALGLLAAERTRVPCETLFRDETVGALDADYAAAYVAMLRRARERGGYHQVLFVTHDERVAGLADALVRVDEDGSVRVA